MAPSPSVSLIPSGHHPFSFTIALLSYLSSCFSGKPASLLCLPAGFPSLETSFLLSFSLMFSSFNLSPLGLSLNLKTCLALHYPELAHSVAALSSSCPASPHSFTNKFPQRFVLFTCYSQLHHGCDSFITQALTHQTQLLPSHLFILNLSCLRQYPSNHPSSENPSPLCWWCFPFPTHPLLMVLPCEGILKWVCSSGIASAFHITVTSHFKIC